MPLEPQLAVGSVVCHWCACHLARLYLSQRHRLLTIYTNHLGANLVITNKTTKFDEVGELPHKSAERLKRVEKLHRLKLQPIFSQASQTDLRVPFDFPWGISGFPL